MGNREEPSAVVVSLAHRVPDLGALELLLAVARLGRLGGGARGGGDNQPAAGSPIPVLGREVGERLLSGEADLGFVEGVSVPPGLDSTVIAHDRLIVVTAPGHAWARRRRPL